MASARHGPGWANQAVALPTLRFVTEVPEPLPINSVWIGLDVARLTPWCNPFEAFNFGTPYEEYGKFLLQRADLHEFIEPLWGKTLLCNCGSAAGCHGALLVGVCEELHADRVRATDLQQDARHSIPQDIGTDDANHHPFPIQGDTFYQVFDMVDNRSNLHRIEHC